MLIDSNSYYWIWLLLLIDLTHKNLFLGPRGWILSLEHCMYHLLLFHITILLLFYSFSKNINILGSEYERKVKEVTLDTEEMPDSSILSEIAYATNSSDHYDEIMTVIWERLDQRAKEWRIIYKVCLFSFRHLFI